MGMASTPRYEQEQADAAAAEAAHAILHDQGPSEEQSPTREDSESDHERSSELGDG
jgi:hypothetical protein